MVVSLRSLLLHLPSSSARVPQAVQYLARTGSELGADSASLFCAAQFKTYNGGYRTTIPLLSYDLADQLLRCASLQDPLSLIAGQATRCRLCRGQVPVSFEDE